MTDNKFVYQGIFLYLDSLILAAAGWAYWIMISKITATADIGQASSIFSLAALLAGVAQLGLEYPLLKRSNDQAAILGTSLIIEIIICSISIPAVLYVVHEGYHESLQFSIMTIALILFSSIGFITRFSLLGVSNIKSIFIIDVSSIGVRFLAGYFLVTAGYSSTGIVLSFLFQQGIVTIVTLYIAKKRLGFKLGNFGYARRLIKEGLANTPSKLSKMIIFTLSIVLLASFGISDSSIGIYYIAQTISLAAGGLALNIAFMAIPASSTSKKDFSLTSMRIGLAFTAPLIVTLVVAPQTVLSIIGPEYTVASTVLVLLSLNVLPASIVNNAITQFNNLGRSKALIITGIVELSSFLVSFWLLVPIYGTIGAALSILISFISSAILSIIWSGRTLARYAATTSLAVATGCIVGLGTNVIFYTHIVFTLLASIGATIGVTFILKVISISEIYQVITRITPKNRK